MTTLHERDEQGQASSMRIGPSPTEEAGSASAASAASAGRDPYKIDFKRTGADRRDARRHDLEPQGISVSRWGEANRDPQAFGRLVDLSASGVRIRTPKQTVQPDGRIRLRLELPAYAGISPFIDATGEDPRPTREWVGHLEVARIRPVAGRDEIEVAGRLVDMADHDRGMLGLYLSTQPLAA